MDDVELCALPGDADLSDAQTEKVPGELLLANNVDYMYVLRGIEAEDGFRVFAFGVQEMLDDIFDSLTSTLVSSDASLPLAELKFANATCK